MAPEIYAGIAASLFCGIYLMPQLFKLLKTHKAQELSITMLLLLFAGLSFWIVYGVMKKDWLIIISNSFSLCVNTVITILSLRYRKKEKGHP